MKAAVVGEHGVEIRDVDKPAPKPNEVLIRVRASSLNRADLLVAQGHQHAVRLDGTGSLTCRSAAALGSASVKGSRWPKRW